METYIFDFDGTLADSKQCSVLATQQAFRKLNLEIPTIEKIEYFMGIPIEQSFKEMASMPLGEDTFNDLLSTFRLAYKELENDTLTLFPHIKEVLQQLQQQDKRCYVVSSKKTDVLLRNLETLEIDSYFDDWIGSDQVEHYKPHPDGIFKLVERYHFAIEKSIMIGDAIFDVQMGQAAGCQTCAVTWGSHAKDKLAQEHPTFIIDEVLMLLKLEDEHV